MLVMVLVLGPTTAVASRGHAASSCMRTLLQLAADVLDRVLDLGGAGGTPHLHEQNPHLTCTLPLLQRRVPLYTGHVGRDTLQRLRPAEGVF